MLYYEPAGNLSIPIFIPPVVPFLLLCCDCGGTSGGGAGFEPVPECSDGAIHAWAVEGPQPQPTVSISLEALTFGTQLNSVCTHEPGDGKTLTHYPRHSLSQVSNGKHKEKSTVCHNSMEIPETVVQVLKISQAFTQGYFLSKWSVI